MEEAEGRTRLLADLASALTVASYDLQRVLDTAATSAATLVGDGAVLRVADAAGFLTDTAVYHPDAEKGAAIRAIVDLPDQRAEDGISGTVARTGRVLVDNAVTLEKLLASNPQRLHEFVSRLDIRALIMAPLTVGDRYVGFLALVRHNGIYGPADERLIADIAARVALAVGTAQIFGRLRAEQDNYRQIVETSLEGVWKTDTAGVTTFVNARMAEILGTTREELIGQTGARWSTDPATGDNPRRVADRLAGHSERYEIQLRRADDMLVWVHVSAAPIRDERGEIVGVLAMVSDISDRKRSEELSRRLEQLQRLDSLGQLAGGIAHDFNNMLSVIGGFADLWRAEVPEDAPGRECADQIATAVQRGAALTRQLLAFGRGQPGKAEVLDLDEVITEVAPMLRRTIGEHIQLIISQRPASALPCRIRIDRGHLEQAVVNLAVNARDAMPRGGRLSIDWDLMLQDCAEIGVPVAGGPDKAWFARLAVSDNGDGMDAETIAHAFEPFYTTKGVGHGTGLGLASVYGIARHAGGVVQLYSEVGHGTTVKIYVPACDDEMTAAPPSLPVQSAGIDRTPTTTHVLVVEDSPELAAVVQRLLDQGGYQVSICCDPAEALALLDGGLPADLVITDVVMPTLSGPELAEAIHRQRPGLPVIFTSGYTAGVLGDRARLPADALLVEKPFSRTTLLQAVDAALHPASPPQG